MFSGHLGTSSRVANECFYLAL